MPKRFDVAVVGGGAAGLAAAVGAGRRGRSVVICERMSRLGKKILVTGGGRCNLLNDDLDPAAFSGTGPDLVAAVFGRFGKNDILSFFRGLGLETYSDDGRIFPVTNQAASVLKVLELEIRRLGVTVEPGFEVVRIEPAKGGFGLKAVEGKALDAAAVVLAGGGKSYPALGSNGSGYDLARSFGHRVVPPVPSAVPLLVRDPWCHLLQGQKVRARASAEIDAQPEVQAEGEVLFAQYGLSGTAVLDVSECLSVALNRDRRKEAAVVLDLVPFMTTASLKEELGRRLRTGWAGGDLTAGLLPEKFGSAVRGLLPLGRPDPQTVAAALASALKARRFGVHGTRGWNEAEFTSGGVDAREVDPRTLESKRREGLHLAGEILDVQAGRGGYNLAWAWASGFIAGESAAGSAKPE